MDYLFVAFGRRLRDFAASFGRRPLFGKGVVVWMWVERDLIGLDFLSPRRRHGLACIIDSSLL